MTRSTLSRIRNWTQRCVYCGGATNAPAQLACRAHRDLLKLDPRYTVRR